MGLKQAGMAILRQSKPVLDANDGGGAVDDGEMAMVMTMKLAILMMTTTHVVCDLHNRNNMALRWSHRVGVPLLTGNAVQCSAVQCSAVQCSAVQCSAVQCRPQAVVCTFAAVSCIFARGICLLKLIPSQTALCHAS